MNDMRNDPQWRAWCFERVVGGLPVHLADMPAKLDAADMLMQFIMTGAAPSDCLKSPAPSSEELSQYPSADPQFETNSLAVPVAGAEGLVSPRDSSSLLMGESAGEFPTPSRTNDALPLKHAASVSVFDAHIARRFEVQS